MVPALGRAASSRPSMNVSGKMLARYDLQVRGSAKSAARTWERLMMSGVAPRVPTALLSTRRSR